MMLDRRSQVFVSAMSADELAIEHHLGRLQAARGLMEMWEATLRECDFEGLPFGGSVARRAGALTGGPRDPFDRAIVASAQVHGFTLVTADESSRRANWVSTPW
jgi:PIN domain nuclease of toxin-antitoxin system